ncbi:17319_t:CDS:2, partial [Acaulospora morrowiae]
QVAERVANFGSGLIKHTGLEPKDLLGIFMNSRPEWVIADLASSHYSLVTVAMPSSSPRLTDVINQLQLTDVRVIVVSEETLPIIFSASSSPNSLRHVILVGDNKTVITDEQRERANALKLNLCSFEEIEEIGKKERVEYNFAAIKDTATIVFSRGTTSEGPKGIELTHENILADIAGILTTVHDKQRTNHEDRY